MCVSILCIGPTVLKDVANDCIYALREQQGEDMRGQKALFNTALWTNDQEGSESYLILWVKSQDCYLLIHGIGSISDISEQILLRAGRAHCGQIIDK